MASTNLIPRENLEGVAPVVGKQKAVDENNRRALIDVTNRGDAEQRPFNRPVTRSFVAQLHAKQQETVTENKIAVVVEGPVVRKEAGAVRKVAFQKKVTVNPKPEVIIEISPDKEEEDSEPRKQSRGSSSRKKKIYSLTSILTARSKVACGITNKPKDPVVDIDAADADNQLAAAEYVEDIYKFYRLIEGSSQPPPDYMDSQPEINEKMRAILVDWLIEVHHKFELVPETMYLTIHIVDRYLSAKAVPRKTLQLVGMASMLIASKYEEIWAPEVNDFIHIADNAYTREQLLVMEKSILGKLEWSLTVPTLYVFLTRYIKAAASNQEVQGIIIHDNRMESLVYFLAELALMNYEFLKYCPSMVAASAVYAARCTLKKKNLWDETLKCYTGYTEEQLLECAKLLVHFHTVAAESKLQTVRRKFLNPLRGGVALLPPASDLCLEPDVVV